MISGRQALAQLEQAIAQARADEARLEAAYRAAGERAAALRTRRMEAFRELARLKLDALTRDGVMGELRSAEQRALALLADRRVALDHLAERRREAEAEVRTLEAERHARAQAVEGALAAIEALRAKVAEEAKGGAEWAAQRARMDEAQRIAEEARKKASQADADREEKRKPYEADPLFMYLWRKKFGTPEDRSGALVRFFDRRVARLIGYDKARLNYQLLNEIPVRLRNHAAQMLSGIEAERARLAAVERAALVEAGIEPLERAAAEARTALEKADRDLAAARAALAREDEARGASMRQGDVRYREAVELLAAADARQDLQVLYRRAAATPAPEDDAIVRRIDEAERGIGQAEQEMGAIQHQLGDLAGRRTALERERDEFVRRGYDNPWGSFSNEAVLGSVIGGVLGGLVQGTVLRDALSGGYQRQPSPWDSDFGSSLRPFPTDEAGWSGGGPWGGGGSDGDGFTTGGSA